MKILFSPAESKSSFSPYPPISKSGFVFDGLYDKRLEIVNIYNNFVMSADDLALAKLFGVKEPQKIENLRGDIFSKGTNIAMERYSGVAYEHLRYGELDEKAKSYINSNCMIFSNLFGPISPLCFLPEYKLKQGESIGNLNIEAFYKEHFSQAIDEYLSDDVVLDLRAGFYEKFYDIKKPYIAVKFLKGGKVVSHYAKAYRGLMLAQMAKQNIKSKEEFESMQMRGLYIVEIRKSGLKTQYTFEISDS